MKGIVGSDACNITVQYNFKNSIIVATSNLYQNEVIEAFHKFKEIDQVTDLFIKLNAYQPLPTSFSPELLSRVKIIPFAPIPRGKCYQNLLKSKLKVFLTELKEEFSCRDIELENEQLVLKALEQKLYGEGTNIRKVRDYFDTIQAGIHRIAKDWGNMQNLKLVFTQDSKGLYIKPLIYLEIFKIYHDPEADQLRFN